jgi:Fe2+ transport system protein FeoA
MLSRLIYCKNGEKVKLENINGGRGAGENVKNLGLSVGDEVEVVNGNHSSGPITVQNNGHSVDVGKELAAKLIVETGNEFNSTLDKMRVGDTVEITKVNSNGDIRFRLLDMGLVRGEKMEILRFAPLGDPIEVKIKGFHLSLRLEEAKSIDVKLNSVKLNGNGKRGNWFSFTKNEL